MKVLYCHSAPARSDSLAYHRELASIDAALAHAPRHPDSELVCVEFHSRVDLRRALLRTRYDIVVLAGHGPGFGLFERAGAEYRRRCAEVFAEILAHACAPNACVLLMGCCSSWLAPALARRGLSGASFDRPVPVGAVYAFLGGFFDGICAERRPQAAYIFGCMAMAYDYPQPAKTTRWFGPEFDPERGYHHEWMVPFPEHDDVDWTG